MGRKINLFFVTCCILLIVLIGGCEGRVQEEEVQEEIVLKTASMYGGTTPNAKVYQAINEEFAKEYENVTIEDESQICDEDWKMKVATNFAVGNEPDIIQFFTDAVAESFLETDKLVSLEEIKKEYPEYAEDIEDSALEAVRNKDGVLRAVPTTGYWAGLFCNKELFQKYQVNIPTDWDSLVEAIHKFRKNGIIPIAVSLNHIPHYWIEHLLLYTVGEEEYTIIPENAPKAWLKAFETLKELKNMGAFPENTDTCVDNCATQLFRKGEAAMQLEGSWYASSLSGTKMDDNVTVVSFPGVPNQKAKKNALIGGIFSGFYITRRAWNNPKKRELAVRFVEAHTKRESLIKYWGGNGIATFKGKADVKITPIVKDVNELIRDASSLNKSMDSRICPEAYKLLMDGVADVVEGKKDAESLLEEVLLVEKGRK
ncbi:ABC transporter substrate-binding protein [Faecalimonas sp.]